MSDSEQKKFPPSAEKLRKIRKKGQVAASPDFVSAIMLLTVFVVLLVSYPNILAVLQGIFARAIFSWQGPAMPDTWATVSEMTIMLGSVILPLLAAAVLAAIVANIAHKGGLVVSVHPIKPDFKKLNPAAGLKRLFSKRNAFEYGIVLVRCVLWFATVGFLLWQAVPALIAAPNCGQGCSIGVGTSVLLTICAAATGFVLVCGLLDLPFQVFMFRHEQRMSQTEVKRENKEMEGSPEFSGYRRDQHRILSSGGGRMGVRAASILITSSSTVIGVRYEATAEGVPVIVSRITDQTAGEIEAMVTSLGVPVVMDAALVDRLSFTPVGLPVPAQQFAAVAEHLVRNNLI